MKIKGSNEHIFRAALWIGLGLIECILLNDSWNRGSIFWSVIDVVLIVLSLFYINLNFKEYRLDKLEEAQNHG
jgi:hypothetical protein